jgi:predicted component of type VI protein secretion system
LVLTLLIPRLIERFEPRPQVDQAGIAEVTVDPGNSL